MLKSKIHFCACLLTLLSGQILLADSEAVFQKWLLAERQYAADLNVTTSLDRLCSVPRESKNQIEIDKCASEFNSINDKSTIKISYNLGLLDFGNDALDLEEKDGLAKFIERPCEASTSLTRNSMCGFKKSNFDENLWTKEITWPNGKKKTVEFRITNPSVGRDISQNKRDPLQRQKAQESSVVFHESIMLDDLIFYGGHSRYGRGPSFNSEKEKTTGLMLEFLGRRQESAAFKTGVTGPPLIFGLMSCSSETHFLQALSRNKNIMPKHNILSTKDVNMQEGYLSTLGPINNVLNGNCPIVTKSSLEPIFTVQTNNRPVTAASFECASHAQGGVPSRTIPDEHAEHAPVNQLK